MSLHELVPLAALGFLMGLVGSLAFSWRTWVDMAVDYRHHGFDNHPCHREGCCR